MILTASAALLTAGQPYEPNAISAVDGDTLKVDGVSVRISNLDTPERGGRAECDAEKFLAAVASKRAQELVETGAVVIWPEGRADRYNRPLARVTVHGKDWAEIMISEFLAVRWEGHQHNWCD